MPTPPADTSHGCPEEDLLWQFLRDELPEDAGQTVEVHVEICRTCQQLLQRLVGGLPLPARMVPEPGQRPADEMPPSLPGYELVGRIEAGGMGVIWRVRDLPFQRELALKVMKTATCHDDGLVQRFIGEAQICAQLAHPYIVPAHTMGRLADGRPYYTMKLVEGQTLAALLDARPEPEHRRLPFIQVFGEVCQAVAFAHRKAIVHRDLKPDNIMVGAQSEVQLMDWGLAKVLMDARRDSAAQEEQAAILETTCDTADQTRVGSVLGTAAYMPPEQARGRIDQVDQQSDVFGLGAILCQILTGQPPYTGPDSASILRQASGADLANARQRLRACGADPELIHLAEQCLSPNKADRPADAGAVAAVVAAYRSSVQERWQEERLQRERQQVLAAEERRRRKLWMGLTASVLAAVLLLSVGLVVVNRLRTQEQSAKEQAQKREQETRAVMDELSSTVIDGWLSRQPQLTREQKDFLKKGLAYYQRFTQETGRTPAGRAALARAYRRVGVIRRQLSLLPEAEKALRHATEIVESLARQFPKVTTYQRDAADALRDLAAVLYDRGADDQAASLLENAIGHQQVIVQRPEAAAPAQAALAQDYRRLGEIRSERQQSAQAGTAFQHAFHILRPLVRAAPDVAEYHRDLALVYRDRGMLLYNTHQIREADASFDQAIAILKKLAADYPFVPDYRHQLALAYTSRCGSLWKLGQLTAARDAVRRSAAILKSLVDEFPAVPRYRQQLASARNNLSIVLKDLGQWPEAETALRQAIRLRERLVHDSPTVVDYAAMLGSSYSNLGVFLREQGHPTAALEWFGRGMGVLDPILARTPELGYVRRYLRNACSGRAEALDELGRHSDAARDWDRASALDDGKRRLFYQGRAALARGHAAQAAALAGQQARVHGADDDTLHDCARTCGLAATTITENTSLREKYAAEALALLRQAIAAGYQNGPADDLRTDPAFRVLRGRSEFQRLLTQAERKENRARKGDRARRASKGRDRTLAGAAGSVRAGRRSR